MTESGETEASGAAAPYQVLARKHRPQDFSALIGQEAMVRTLKNAFAHDRIAHAFILTGVRGVGKTTTARIIAKGLNCVEGPTTSPCGVCDACVRIAEGRFIDVLEIDAASSTGVDSIRELNRIADGKPTNGRFKVFIFDEVHMLSTSAFNALLKTLEEPPAHVKFIFATTEIRKVPVTILSRCQRFDLRRIEPEVMLAHLRGIADGEGAEIDDRALALITRAAEGSVRDALSLLDQAIAHGGGGAVGADEVRSMLGLADRGRMFDFFEAIMKGDAAGALAELSRQYADGADPGAILRDLAELTHWISVLKISPASAEDPTVPAAERERGQDLAARLSLRALTRAWQMLLKAMEELPLAPNAMMAAEMAVIRLTHVADLPSPEDLVRRLSGAGGGGGSAAPSGGGGGGGGGVSAVAGGRALTAVAGGGSGGAVRAAAPEPARARLPESFPAAIGLIREARDLRLAVEAERHMAVIRYEPGLIEFRPVGAAPVDLAGRLSEALRALTGARWSVIVGQAEGSRTLADEKAEAAEALRTAVSEHPLVLAALEVFPDAKIGEIRPLRATREEAAELAAPVEADDMDDGTDWVEIDGDLIDMDPFEEDI